MLVQGRWIDPIALWSEFVDFPANLGHPLPTFLPLVTCPNPEHQTHKRHFQINTKQPLVHCFANCGISGTYEHAIALIRGCSEREAMRLVLRASRLPLTGEFASAGSLGTRKSIDGDSAIERDRQLLDGGAFQFLPRPARAYLDGRGVDGPARGKWQIGFDEDTDRLVIPAYDERSTFRFLIRQRIDGRQYQKYLYTPGGIKTGLLFGACYLDRQALQSLGLVLVEGPLDAIRLHQLGIATAVAILGTGISRKQARLVDKFGPRRVYLMFDRDGAGASNIESAKQALHKVPIFVCRYPGSRTDPAEMTSAEVERSIERALPLHVFERKARDAMREVKVGS